MKLTVCVKRRPTAFCPSEVQLADQRMKLLTGLWFDRGTATEEWLQAFEAYGHVMACEAALELQIALSLCKLRVLEWRRRSAGAYPHDDFMAYASSLRKKSLSKLIPLAKKNFKLSAPFVEGLELGKRARDALAHNFWDTNLGFLHTSAGVALIVEQCSLESWHFKNLSADLEREIGFDVLDFVEATQRGSAAAEKGIEEVLRNYR